MPQSRYANLSEARNGVGEDALLAEARQRSQRYAKQMLERQQRASGRAARAAVTFTAPVVDGPPAAGNQGMVDNVVLENGELPAGVALDEDGEEASPMQPAGSPGDPQQGGALCAGMAVQRAGLAEGAPALPVEGVAAAAMVVHGAPTLPAEGVAAGGPLCEDEPALAVAGMAGTPPTLPAEGVAIAGTAL